MNFIIKWNTFRLMFKYYKLIFLNVGFYNLFVKQVRMMVGRLLWRQRWIWIITWWRHTPLFIYFTPTQGRIIKCQILILQIRATGNIIYLFSFSRLSSDGLGSGNKIFLFSFFAKFFSALFSFFFYFFFVNLAINFGFQFFLPLIFKITTRIF